MESTASTVIDRTTELEQFRCQKCGARLFDYKVDGGVMVVECKCYKHNCKHLNKFCCGAANA